MKKQEQKNKTVFHAVAALLAVLAVVLVLYGGGRWLEKRAEKPETRTQLPQADQETVEVDGVTYRKKSRLTTILVMGVDHDTQDSYEYRKAGQADFLRLVVLDDADKTVQQLQIDRDTMTPVTVLGLLGDRYEPVTEQICLGYAFGDGRESSCEVTVEAVGNLLGGQTIDQYLAMGLDGISTLNDLAGGVTVTLEDDFSAIDPAMTKGTTLTLQGEQAETYVRSRRSVGVGTNEARMARQESYIRQLSVQLDEKLQKDQNFAVDAYDALQPYLTTSMAKGQLVNEAWAAKDYTRLDTIKPDGTYQVGEDGFMEFYPDADALQQAVLQLFYEKVEKSSPRHVYDKDALKAERTGLKGVYSYENEKDRLRHGLRSSAGEHGCRYRFCCGVCAQQDWHRCRCRQDRGLYFRFCQQRGPAGGGQDHGGLQ